MIVPYIYTGPSSCAYKSGNTVFGGVVTRGNLAIVLGGMYPIHYQSALTSYPLVDSSMWNYTADVDVTYQGALLYSAHFETYEHWDTSLYAPQGTQVKMRIKVNPYTRTYVSLPSSLGPDSDFTAVHSASLSPYEYSASGVVNDVTLGKTVSARASIIRNEFTIGNTAAGVKWIRYVNNMGRATAVVPSGFSWQDGSIYTRWHHYSSDSAYPTAETDVSGLMAQHYTFPTSTYPVYKPKIGNYTQYADGRMDWAGYYYIGDAGALHAHVFGSSFTIVGTSSHSKFGPDVSSCVISDPNAPLVLDVNRDYYSSTPTASGVGSARAKLLVP